MNTKSLLPVLLVPVIILLIPAAMMMFKVEGWEWSPFDFIVMWVLMTGVGLAYKFITRKDGSTAYRVAAGLGLGAGFLLIWVNGAVGLIGSEDNPANALYAVVLAVGAVGAAIARFEPIGMSWALLATAVAQFLVPVVALIVWRNDFSPGVPQVFTLNFVFVLLFAGSSILFRQAAGKPDKTGVHRTA